MMRLIQSRHVQRTPFIRSSKEQCFRHVSSLASLRGDRLPPLLAHGYSSHTRRKRAYSSTSLVIHRPRLLLERCRSSLNHEPTVTQLPQERPRRNGLGRRARTASFGSTTKRRGLFSIPELQQPLDFDRLAQRAMDECDALRHSLQDTDALAALSLDDILIRLDDISKHVCNVIDVCELTRSVSADPAWKQAAQNTFGQLSDYIVQLNGDVRLYQALVHVVQRQQQDSSEKGDTLSQESKRFVALLKAEFEKDGIHLLLSASPGPSKQAILQEIRDLQNSVTELESLFTSNMVQCTRQVVLEAQPVLDVIPQQVLEAYGATLTTSDNNDDANHHNNTLGVQLADTNSAILQSLLRYSDNASLRRDVWMASNTAVSENLAVLAALQRQRHALAKTLGFDSYASRYLMDKMISSNQLLNVTGEGPRGQNLQANVYNFLYTLQKNTAPQYRHDMDQVLTAKRLVEQRPNVDVVEPWDIAYYVGLIKAQKQRQYVPEGSDEDVTSSLSNYLTIDNSVAAMQTLVKELFGIDMTEVAMTVEERWDMAPAETMVGDNDQHKVRRYDFTHVDSSTALGTMYLDLHPRPNKYGHAAHFTIRCGCAIHPGSSVTTMSGSDHGYQLPIVALVCNLSTGPTISHGEVETLFHEFGHALHSLLSRTTFQHMSGTRAAMDFVETPSHLMENFVWDPQFLRQYLCKHYETGTTVPDHLIRGLVSSRYDFSSIERQNQILYAIFDQKLFGVPPDTPMNSTDLFASLHNELGVPFANGTHWHSKFGHLVTYGAGYYGYLYSQVFANDIWNHCFVPHSLSRESGTALWKKLLVHGGAKDPSEMLTDLTQN